MFPNLRVCCSGRTDAPGRRGDLQGLGLHQLHVQEIRRSNATRYTDQEVAVQQLVTSFYPFLRNLDFIIVILKFKLVLFICNIFLTFYFVIKCFYKNAMKCFV